MSVRPARGQPVDQCRSVRPISLDVSVDLVGRVERGQRCDLRDVRRADVHVLLQALDDVDERIGYDDPADAPAGHRPVLREAVDDERVGLVVEDARRRLAVDDAVVDLVGDDGDVVAPTEAGDHRQRLVVVDRAGRVRGRGDDQPVEVTDGLELIDGRRPSIHRIDRDRHRVDSECGEHVAVARVARARRCRPGCPARTVSGTTA